MCTTFILKVTIPIKAINKNKPFYLACGSPLILYVQNMMHHIALRCLEGSTMSNLVHRQRRCARIVPLYGIVRKRKGKERERQSLERSLEPLEPLEPFEPFEPLEPIEPLASSKTKTKINPLMRMEGCALMSCFRLGLIRASS